LRYCERAVLTREAMSEDDAIRPAAAGILVGTGTNLNTVFVSSQLKYRVNGNWLQLLWLFRRSLA
jgi:hypothetical protein